MKRHTTIGRLAHVGVRLDRNALLVLAIAGFLVPLRAIPADQDDSASGATAVVNPDDLREVSRETAAFSGELDKSLSAVDFEAAANVMAKILEVEERVFGRGHWRTFDHRLELATLRRAAAACRADQILIVECFTVRRTLHELVDSPSFPSSPDDAAKAEAVCRRLLYTARAIVGSEDNLTLGLSLDLAHLKLGAESFAEAEAAYRELLPEVVTLYTKDHQRHAVVTHGLGLALKGQGKHEAAERMLRASVDTLRRTVGPDSVQYAIELQTLADFLNGRGRFEEAEPVAAEAVDIARKHLAPDHLLLLRSLHELAIAQSGQMKWKHVIATAEDLLPRAMRGAPAGSRRTAELLEMYAAALRALGKLEGAERAETRARVMRASPAGSTVIKRPRGSYSGS